MHKLNIQNWKWLISGCLPKYYSSKIDAHKLVPTSFLKTNKNTIEKANIVNYILWMLSICYHHDFHEEDHHVFFNILHRFWTWINIILYNYLYNITIIIFQEENYVNINYYLVVVIILSGLPHQIFEFKICQGARRFAKFKST